MLSISTNSKSGLIVKALSIRNSFLLLLCFGLFSSTGGLTATWAHNNENNSDQSNSGVNIKSHNNPIDSEPTNNFPIKFGGKFELIDHNGNQVTNQYYQGKKMLVFFGYVSCKNMCSLSLSRIGKALTLLGDSAQKLSPLVITVDPERDSPTVLKSALAKYHPGLIGLTGEPEKLKMAYDNFKLQPTIAGKDWDDDPIISHSSYIYLLDENGKFTTLFPPILNPQSMADIIRKYIDKA